MKVRNTFIIFLISGFWHGANWTFVIWGALNAIYFLPLLLTNNNRKNLGVVAEGKIFPSFRELIAILTTFTLTVFAWIFFRAENISHAFSYIGEIFSETLFSVPYFKNGTNSFYLIILILIFLYIEWLGRKDQFGIQYLGFKWKRPYRYAFYNGLIIAIILFGNDKQQFIYFQF